MEKQTFENNEPVLLYINIRNISGIKSSFKIYDADFTTFRPVVYDMNGREADTLVTYRLQNKSIEDVIKDINPRIIELLHNEIFSYAIDLKKIYRVVPEQEYRVKSMFFPDAGSLDSIISSNQLKFNTITIADDIKNSGISRIKRFISPRRDLSPSEIVLLFLKAEKDRDWDDFFKYIDIENYIYAYPDYVRIYNQAIQKNDLEKKERIVLQFVNFLKEERSDYIISYIIQNELKRDENNSYVEALVKRFGTGTPSIYKCRYSLEKYENLWLITDIEVTVAKGQKL